MQNVGGQMNYCKIVASSPTVIAEMSFLDRTGADKVIEMFNNKKVSTHTIKLNRLADTNRMIRRTVVYSTSTLSQPAAASLHKHVSQRQNRSPRGNHYRQWLTQWATQA